MTEKLSLSKRLDPNGCGEVYIRITLARGKVFRIKTGIHVPAMMWNNKTKSVIIPRLHTTQQMALIQLQTKIDGLKNLLFEKLSEIPISNIDKPLISNITREYLRSFVAVQPSNPENDKFKNAYESFIKLQVKTSKRVEQYRCLWKQMLRYEVYMKGVFSWKFGIEAENILDFEQFLLLEPSFFESKGKPKKEFAYVYTGIEIPRRIDRGKNAVACIIKRLRIFYNWATKNKLHTDSNPFDNYQGHQCVFGTPFYMTKVEMDTLFAFDFSNNKRLEFHRDLFIFQSNVGMRVGDLFMLTHANINNNEYLEYIPNKTLNHSGKSVRVPLTKVAKQLIAKYADTGRAELFPFENSEYYNKDIKTVLRMASIDRIITVYDPLTSTNVQRCICDVASSHMARRNFIGNLYDKVADPSIIGAMTGHVDGSKAFARYRAISDDLKLKALQALE